MSNYAKIVKLNKIQRIDTLEKSFESSAGTSVSDESSNDFDVSGEYLTKLYVIKDYSGNLVYGDLTVVEGDYVYLISESEFYFFVENNAGIQGFLPKEVCIDLQDMLRKAALHQMKSNVENFKITSL